MKAKILRTLINRTIRKVSLNEQTESVVIDLVRTAKPKSILRLVATDSEVVQLLTKGPFQ